MSFTKIPIFVPIIVHDEVVDIVEVVRLLQEHDIFLLFGNRVFESLLDNQRESALSVVPEES